MRWDCEIEPPATIAVIGGGPAGIEAAIYARFLGYDCLLFDAARPARFVKRWHQRPMGASAAALTTPLGWAAIRTQEPDSARPELTQAWTGEQFERDYLTPLAKTDLVHDCVQFNSPVVEVCRHSLYRWETEDLQARANAEFRLLVDSRYRGRYWAAADAVIDCRSIRGRPLGLGPGGGQAIGQHEHQTELWDTWPMDDRFELHRAEAMHFLLCGLDAEAIRFAEELSRVLAGKKVASRLHWLVRPQELAEADALAAGWTNQTGCDPALLQTVAGFGMARIEKRGERWGCELMTADDASRPYEVDAVVSLAKGEFDPSIAPTLRLADRADGEPNFVTGEPNYYALPAPRLPLGEAGLKPTHAMIRELFALLGGRENLDLYDIVRRQIG